MRIELITAPLKVVYSGQHDSPSRTAPKDTSSNMRIRWCKCIEFKYANRSRTVVGLC